MEATLSHIELLQFYIDAGADEAIGNEAFDRFKTVTEKIAILPAFTAPEPAAPVQETITGTFEAIGEAKELAASATTIAELRTALENFKPLTLKRTASHMVFADGNPAAKIMLVGDVPGTDEDRIGKPFAGPAGQLLDKMLAAIGLSRETHVYISNIMSWRPPGNRLPTDSEMTLSLPFIVRHIELVNPAILVYIGGGSAKALLQTTHSINRLRGKWTEYKSSGLEKPVPSMAIFHPSYLLSSPAEKSHAWADLLNLKAKIQELGIEI